MRVFARVPMAPNPGRVRCGMAYHVKDQASYIRRVQQLHDAFMPEARAAGVDLLKLVLMPFGRGDWTPWAGGVTDYRLDQIGQLPANIRAWLLPAAAKVVFSGTPENTYVFFGAHPYNLGLDDVSVRLAGLLECVTPIFDAMATQPEKGNELLASLRRLNQPFYVEANGLTQPWCNEIPRFAYWKLWGAGEQRMSFTNAPLDSIVDFRHGITQPDEITALRDVIDAGLDICVNLLNIWDRRVFWKLVSQ